MVERDDSGRFTEKNTDNDILSAVQKCEPAATSEIANELGITRQSADYRLRNLTNEGKVNRKKIGAVVVWWITNSKEE